MSDRLVDGLNTHEVRARYAEAEESLRAIARDVETVNEARITEARAASSMEGAAVATRQLSDQAGQLMDRLRAVAEDVETVIGRAASVLDGSDIAEMKQSLRSVDEAIAARATSIHAKLDSTARGLEESLSNGLQDLA